jgi:hypothetical protein
MVRIKVAEKNGTRSVCPVHVLHRDYGSPGNWTVLFQKYTKFIEVSFQNS